MAAASEKEYNPSKADNRSNYYLTDFFSNYDEVTHKIRTADDVFEKQDGGILSDIVYYSNLSTWIFYGLSGVLIALCSYLIELSITWLYIERARNIKEMNYVFGLLVFCLTGLILGTISTGICHALATEAQGAGVPEVKCMLTGARMAEFFEFRVFLAKFIGQICALASGLNLGRIGPNIHFGSLITNNLAKLNLFKHIRKDSILKIQSLMIGASVGLSATFGTPLAGLVASVEMVGKVFSIRTIWILFVTLLFSTMTIRHLFSLGLVPEVHQVHFSEPRELFTVDMILFAILGICCGLVSALMISLTMKYQVFRSRPTTPTIFKTRYSYTWSTVLICALLQYHISSLRIGDKAILNEFFSKDQISPNYYIFENTILSLLAFTFLKGFMFFLSMTSPLPGGILGPFILLGCNTGRLYGEIVRKLFGVENIGRFAVAGAAALSATSTRFLAMMLLVLEITRQLELVLPVMIAVLFSFGTGNFFTKSYFYSTIELRKLPYVPKLMKDEVYRKRAKDAMLPPKLFLNANSSFADIFEFLTKGEGICVADYIPVTLDNQDNTLVGVIKTENLVKYFKKELKDRNQDLKGQWVTQLEVLLKLYTFLEEEAVVNASKICERAKKMILKVKQQSRMIKKKTGKDNQDDSDEEEEEMDNVSLNENNDQEKEKEPDTEANLKKALLAPEAQQEVVQEEKYMFFNRKIDFPDPILNFDRSPMIINPSTNLAKVHFLFITLGVSTLFVCEKGVLLGIIKKNIFLGLNLKK